MEQEIMNLIIAITPALTSIVSVIGAVVAMIKKVKSIDNSHAAELRTLNSKMNEVLHENAELKKELKTTLRSIRHIHTDDK